MRTIALLLTASLIVGCYEVHPYVFDPVCGSDDEPDECEPTPAEPVGALDAGADAPPFVCSPACLDEIMGLCIGVQGPDGGPCRF